VDDAGVGAADDASVGAAGSFLRNQLEAQPPHEDSEDAAADAAALMLPSDDDGVAGAVRRTCTSANDRKLH
jgi:hypothetical protein